jgi:hypothetical protein
VKVCLSKRHVTLDRIKTKFQSPSVPIAYRGQFSGELLHNLVIFMHRMQIVFKPSIQSIKKRIFIPPRSNLCSVHCCVLCICHDVAVSHTWEGEESEARRAVRWIVENTPRAKLGCAGPAKMRGLYRVQI